MPDNQEYATPARTRSRATRKATSSTAEKAEKANKDLLARVPPHSVEAEQAVLGGILSRPRAMTTLAAMITPDDFYMPAHQLLFNAFLELDRKAAPVNLVSVAEELKRTEHLEDVGGSVYLAELAKAVVSGANAEYYAGIVRDHAMKRGMITVCSDIIGDCFAPGQDVGELMASTEQRIFNISQRTTGKDFSGAGELVEQVFEHLTQLADSNDEITGVTTGYDRLNKLTAGFQKSDLIIVAARPSMGKTAFAMCLALNAAISQDVPVAVFSLEMSREQLMQRMLAVRAKVDVSRLRRPALLRDEDWQNLGEAAEMIRQSPLYIDDTPALSTLELRARARRLKAEKGLGMVIVDYLQLMRAGRRVDSRELEISEISRSLKGLAKELDIPVVALSQLNRKLEERSDKRPLLSDLRESGAIEQDADMILFVHREDMYKYNKAADRPTKGTAEIIIGKQRNGPVGIVELLYISPYTAFVEMHPGYMGSEEQLE